MKTTLHHSTRNELRNIMVISNFQFLKFLNTSLLDIFFEVTLTFPTLKVKILPDDDSSLINVLSYPIIKKWPSACIDLRSGHFCDLTCLRNTHAPVHYKSMAEISATIKMHRTGSNTSESCRIRL